MQPHLMQPPSPSDQSQTDPKLQQISRDDLKKIEKSMKRPEFMGLLNEYMIEISDPKNKIEYDEYLKQMQRQGQLPKHMKLVNLTAKFCFRTFIVSQKDKKHEMKFFINMCSCEYIEQPSCQPSSGEDGKIGFSWKIPNSMGKIRYDQDKRSNPCQTVDAAFHPDIFQFARKEQFQEMIINIALEAAEKQLGERKETLSKDYVILKKIKCKGNQPALLPIRYIDGKVYNKGQNKEGMERDTEGKQTKLQQQLNQQKRQYQKEKQQKNKEKEQDEENIQDNIQKQQEKEEISGIQRPKVSTIYTYPIDYSEFMEGPTMPKHKKIPSQFNIEFLLPRVQSMGEIDGQSLDLTENRLVLKVGDKYFIDLSFEQLKLKYPLQYENAKAKFDKKKRVLRVTIPTDQIKIKQQQQTTQVQSIVNNKKYEQQQQLEQEIVQQQKWKDKNKLLQLSQQKISNVVMDKIQLNQIKQQKQPLIQQIDQDDYIDQNDKNKLQQQYKQQQQFIITKFTIKNYINNEQIYQKLNQINKLSFVFQENSNAIIIIVRVNHYNSDDVEINYDQSNYNQITMVWNCRDKKSLLHLNVAEAWKHKINSIEVVQRVGFIIFFCNKIDEEKGQFWQSSCIQDRVQQQNIDYGLFNNTVEEIKAKNKQLQSKRQIQKQKEQQQLQQKIQQKQLKQQVSNKQIQEQKINESQVMNKIVQQKNQLSYKQQIQFINFDMTLIQILD